MAEGEAGAKPLRPLAQKPQIRAGREIRATPLQDRARGEKRDDVSEHQPPSGGFPDEVGSLGRRFTAG
jgi:hypothetical protein